MHYRVTILTNWLDDQMGSDSKLMGDDVCSPEFHQLKTAETVGLAFGAIDFFNQALECFRYVRVARGYGEDYETCELRLNLIGLKLSRWGKSVGLDSVEWDELITPHEDRDLAEKTLKHIVKLFESATTDASGLPKDKKTAASSGFEAKKAPIKHLTLGRQNKKCKASFAEKTKWVLYKRDETMKFLETMEGVVNSLRSCFSSDLTRQNEARLCAEEASQIFQKAQNLSESIMETIKIFDNRLFEKLESLSSGSTHHNTHHSTHHNTLNHSGTGTNNGMVLGQNEGTMHNAFGGN
ncbi:hypothetical protein BU23DRAFT_600126 [Bimuria novae-zelandiae CBS 107.79]|uniref:Prion-inhibition and propagation HeLo domain-containing protein n=1 Tax=Bimuria novae-zelandiae CBS 107.79 TaxID=1447943 RepID=A0A6A5V290_9PLEO|nr:hypothetical protein BU23DRAFT_600126 [Bimuria novae-zelandiae CBS 107.79]